MGPDISEATKSVEQFSLEQKSIVFMSWNNVPKGLHVSTSRRMFIWVLELG